MALVIEFTCDLPNGVHARPASLVETLCNRFSSAIEWRNLRCDTGGNAKSALAVIGTNTLKGDTCQLLISGEDEAEAYAALTAFLRDEFPHCDAPLPTAQALDVQPVPESLTPEPDAVPCQSGLRRQRGGRLIHLKSRDLHELGALPVASSPEQEQAALDNGLRLLVKDIELRLLDNDGTASAILEAHRSLATDARCASICSAGSSPVSAAPSDRRHQRPLLRPVPRFRQQLSAGAGAGCARCLLPAVAAYLRRSPFPGAGSTAGSRHLPCRRTHPQPVPRTG